MILAVKEEVVIMAWVVMNGCIGEHLDPESQLLQMWGEYRTSEDWGTDAQEGYSCKRTHGM